jgi:hypothetical protein
MIEVAINEFDLKFIDLVRVALSEETTDLREHAIINVKHDVVTGRIDLLMQNLGSKWRFDPANFGFLQWVAMTAAQRTEAAFEFSETGKRYEAKNERKINIAEYIGRVIYLSIKDKKFEGVQARGGILEQVRDVAKAEGINGARDKDVIREVWKTYRGVVHLGMALDYFEDSPEQGLNVLHLDEEFRLCLSQNCPKGTKAPYVDPVSQISFLYISKLWGPRYGNRGLTFDVD